MHFALSSPSLILSLLQLNQPFRIEKEIRMNSIMHVIYEFQKGREQ